MNNRHLIAIVAAILLIGIGSYAACGMEIAETGDELGAVVPDPDAPPMVMVDAGTDPTLAEPSDDMQAPPSEMEQGGDACGMNTCGAGETCCPVDGQCYPSTCADCCPAQDTLPAPDVEGIDIEDPDLGNPVGPAPEPPGITPPGSPGGPGSPDPGPMPPGPND